jgi:hypothetical protein
MDAPPMQNEVLSFGGLDRFMGHLPNQLILSSCPCTASNSRFVASVGLAHNLRRVMTDYSIEQPRVPNCDPSRQGRLSG